MDDFDPKEIFNTHVVMGRVTETMVRKQKSPENLLMFKISSLQTFSMAVPSMTSDTKHGKWGLVHSDKYTF